MSIIKIEKYKFVVKVTYHDHSPHYYNSHHYIFVSDPRNASRYSSIEAAQKDMHFASCQGGESSVADFDTEKQSYLKD